MSLQTVPWEEISEEELLAEGNAPIVVTMRGTPPPGDPKEYGAVEFRFAPSHDEYEAVYLVSGWNENPQTHTLSLRARVRIPEPLDQVVAFERHLLNADEWVRVRSTAIVFDLAALCAQKEMQEEQARMQAEAETAARLGVQPGPPRSVRRQMGRT